MSCPYKNLFGKPGEGVHKYRIFDIGVIDVAVTIAVAYLIARAFRWPILWVLGGLFLVGIAVHRVLCVRTRVDRWLFHG
jgi:di/tricarboxylate transporter